MRLKLFPLLTVIGLCGVIVLTWANQVKANTPLTRAEIQSLRNFVQLIQRANRNKRPARQADAIIPGDGLSTGRASLADLRFNDGSLARVGEQAVFQFMPKTRNFRLSNGTVLLLIPPGRGQTRIQTPSAAAAIRGSALFVRYDQKTDTTVVGALTNSGIAVSNQNASTTQQLQAGQLLVIVKGEITALYDFDLQNFYETSDLTQGLNLTRKDSSATTDPAIASVQAEIIAALSMQSPLVGQGVIDNPAFLDLTTGSSNLTDEQAEQENVTADLTTDESLVDSLVETGEILFNNAQRLEDSQENIFGGNNSGNENPPVIKPENENPPASNPGNENPPVVKPENENPPAGNPGNDKPVGNAGENPGNNNSGGVTPPDNNNQGGGGVTPPDDNNQGGGGVTPPDDDNPPP